MRSSIVGSSVGLVAATIVSCAAARDALAQTPPPSPPAPAPPPPAAPAPSTPLTVDTVAGKFSVGGYVEASYSYNFNNPSNGITNYRGFDNRHNTFTLSNAVLDGQWEKDAISGRVMLQVGHTPDTYYLSEPSSPGTAAAGSAGASSWKYLQQAYVGYKIPLGKGLLVQLGIFTSPIGVENMAVKDNWNWSRSNLFFGLPFYHTGLKATQQLTDKLAVTAAVYNGWNSVVDNNSGKSVSVQFAYTDADRLLFSVLYFGGPERPAGAPEGQPWRHLLDGWVQFRPTDRLWLGASGDTGFEVNAFGTSWWGAGALHAQVRAAKFLYLAARGDYFGEHAAQNALGTASRLFWPGSWVASGTGTIDVRPRDNIAIRLEYRHDQAPVDMFFKGTVRGDGSTARPFTPNATSQDTLTLGATTWL
jgi:hypothetical protein